MVIINADDWGGWRRATDAALECWREQRITSVTAMVFMEDSERAAELAREHKLSVGLHLNLSQEFTGSAQSERLREYHRQIRRFLTTSKYAVVLHNPFLRRQFRYVYEAQTAEFLRLYGSPPSHLDGHQHKHLCANMLLQRVIASGARVRRNFSFWPGEKSFVNRAYRAIVDKWLARHYRLADYFFDLAQCCQNERLARIFELGRTANVEVMTHPERKGEHGWLMGSYWVVMMKSAPMGTYAMLE